MRKFVQVSLVDINPLSIIPKDHRIVIFRSFFDGSNQADSALYPVLSLASVSGNKAQWKAFETDWKAILKRNDAPWLHTTDVSSLLRDPFTQKNGWTIERADRFVNDCVDVVDRHIVVPKVRPGLIPYVFTVVLADHKRAALENPSVPKNVNEFCAVQSVYRSMQQGAHLGAHFFHFVFDHGEPFRGHILDRGSSKKARKDLGELYSRITSNTEAGMRSVPGLQLADLFGWCISNKNREKRRTWHNRIMRYRRLINEWVDYDRIMKSSPAATEKVKSWSLPPRRATK